jgi:hypothetical protein
MMHLIDRAASGSEARYQAMHKKTFVRV